MINKHYIERNEKVFGNYPWEIEGFTEAISSEEMYVPHHVLEWKYSMEELKQMNRYKKVSADELIWMPQSVHNLNAVLHVEVRRGNASRDYTNVSEETRRKLSDSNKGNKNNLDKIRSEFGAKYFEHFGVHRSANINQYKNEHKYYKRHGHCSWEV